MKKILVCLLVLCPISVLGQTVMGVDIKTTISSFNKQMATKGYKPYKTVLGKYEYIVTFAGYPHCNYMVEYNTDTDSICQVEITFLHESVSKDEEIYTDLKSQLIAKYGTPTHEIAKTFKDSPEVLAVLDYRNVSFNNNPYLVWHFGKERGVRLSYHTGARWKKTKPAYSPDI